MPELPEVETVKNGLEPLICNCRIEQVICRIDRLRLPLDPHLSQRLRGRLIKSISRRAKYLLIHLDQGTLLIHLGMSGVLRFVATQEQPQKHDHVDILFNNNSCLRFNDPRRFGLLLYLETDPFEHRLLKNLGPEPLAKNLATNYLFQASRKRRLAIKSFIMDQKILVGVGNIYASEALFAAGIDPRRPAQSLTSKECCQLLHAIQTILAKAIAAGGTTLKDFRQSDGKPGYFKQELQVYGRTDRKCHKCNAVIQQFLLGQRTTYFCPGCQR